MRLTLRTRGNREKPSIHVRLYVGVGAGYRFAPTHSKVAVVLATAHEYDFIYEIRPKY